MSYCSNIWRLEAMISSLRGRVIMIMQPRCAASNGHSHRCALGSRKRFDWIHVLFHVFLTVFTGYTISSLLFLFEYIVSFITYALSWRTIMSSNGTRRASAVHELNFFRVRSLSWQIERSREFRLPKPQNLRFALVNPKKNSLRKTGGRVIYWVVKSLGEGPRFCQE